MPRRGSNAKDAGPGRAVVGRALAREIDTDPANVSRPAVGRRQVDVMVMAPAETGRRPVTRWSSRRRGGGR